jgi:hypothetical protein
MIEKECIWKMILTLNSSETRSSAYFSEIQITIIKTTNFLPFTEVSGYIIEFLKEDTISLYSFVTGYGPVRGVDNFRRIQMFLITIGVQPYIHKEFDSCFLFDWNYLSCPL